MQNVFFLIRYFILNALSNLLLYVNVSCLYTLGVTLNCVCDSTVINKCSGFPSSGVAFLCNALVCALASSSLGKMVAGAQIRSCGHCSVPPCVTVVALLGLVYAKTVRFSNLLKEKKKSILLGGGCDWNIEDLMLGCWMFQLSSEHSQPLYAVWFPSYLQIMKSLGFGPPFLASSFLYEDFNFAIFL